VRQRATACGIAQSVPAVYRAPDGSRLVADTRFKRVWIDEVEIDGLKPDSQPFRLSKRSRRAAAPRFPSTPFRRNCRPDPKMATLRLDRLKAWLGRSSSRRWPRWVERLTTIRSLRLARAATDARSGVSLADRRHGSSKRKG